ncbi:glyoxalase [marine bacterium AO1-C]|nr:glyoxalase [marine bacterium AO1-C]
MKIEHIALWVKDLEKMRTFYEQYFGATSNEKYVNTAKQFASYFLSFESGARLEIMHMTSVVPNQNSVEPQAMGLIHFAIATGSKAKVDQLTEELRADGYQVIGEPRTTGDGYYESVVLDPENNRVEITV